jgi:hypothetical protein
MIVPVHSETGQTEHGLLLARKSIVLWVTPSRSPWLHFSNDFLSDFGFGGF